jgi:hypothetical protein
MVGVVAVAALLRQLRERGGGWWAAISGGGVGGRPLMSVARGGGERAGVGDLSPPSHICGREVEVEMEVGAVGVRWPGGRVLGIKCEHAGSHLGMVVVVVDDDTRVGDDAGVDA